jgi:hypothetical protein
MSVILDRLVDWWMRKCPHNDAHVASDILEGGMDDGRVAYCRRCGSVRILYDASPQGNAEWRRPRPLWFRP